MEKRVNRAFTLLEVVLVIAILAIVLAIAIPNFDRYIKDYNIQKQINKLYADINYAKFYGVAHQIPININITQNQIKALTNQTNPVLIVQDNFKYPISCSDNTTLITLNAFGIAKGSVNCFVNEQNNANPNCFKIEFAKISTGRWINGNCKE
ncbi:MAG: pilus assembly FimT family protein [Desulfurella sp.]|uniref:pilus assembly FimT family protein n=1 Tax=Desulfurella sp. TaxID=1962857 RepID=UPI003D0D9971